MLHNERGSSLVYVLLVSAIIAVIVIPLTFMSTTRALTDKNREHQVRADQLAKSIADNVNDYIKRQCTRKGIVPKECVELYPGLGEKSITLPEGKSVRYTLTMNPASSTHYQFDLTAFSDNKSSNISYLFDAPPNTVNTSDGGGSGPAFEQNKLLLPAYPSGQNGNYQMNLPNNGVISTTGTKPPALTTEEYSTYFEGLVPTPTQYTAKNLVELETIMKNAPDGRNITISCDPCHNIILSSETDFTDNPNKTFVVYFPNKTSTGGFSVELWRMNGMLISEGNVNTNLVQKNGGLYVDNLVTNGDYSPDSGTAPKTITGVFAARTYHPDGGTGSEFPTILFEYTSYSYTTATGGGGWSPTPVQAK